MLDFYLLAKLSLCQPPVATLAPTQSIETITVPMVQPPTDTASPAATIEVPPSESLSAPERSMLMRLLQRTWCGGNMR